MKSDQERQPARNGLGGQAARGAAFTGLSQAVKLGTQFLSVIFLSRLLTPADFGLVAMCTPVIAFVTMAQNMGLSQAVVVAEVITPGQSSTLFWVNVGLALVLTLGLIGLSPVIADFYHTPNLEQLIIVMSFCILMSGLSAQHGALVTRAMKFSRLAIIDMACAILGLAGALLWAVLAPGPMALIAMSLTSSLTLLVGVWASSEWRPGKLAPFSAVASMLRFGGGLSTFTLSNFFARSLDNILIGRFIGAQQLGLYDRAYKLLLFPLQQITYPLSRVMVPVLSRLVNEPARYRSAYARTVGQILLVTTPGTLTLFILADAAIPLALGPQWSHAASIFRWLALAALHQSMTATIGWLFISQSRMREYAHWGLFNAFSCAIAFAVGLRWGVEGVAACYALSDIFIRLPALWLFIGRRGPVTTQDLANIAAPFLLAGMASAAALALVTLPLKIPSLALLVVGLIISYGTFVATLLLTSRGRAIVVETFGMMKMILQKV